MLFEKFATNAVFQAVAGAASIFAVVWLLAGWVKWKQEKLYICHYRIPILLDRKVNDLEVHVTIGKTRSARAYRDIFLLKNNTKRVVVSEDFLSGPYVELNPGSKIFSTKVYDGAGLCEGKLTRANNKLMIEGILLKPNSGIVFEIVHDCNRAARISGVTANQDELLDYDPKNESRLQSFGMLGLLIVTTFVAFIEIAKLIGIISLVELIITGIIGVALVIPVIISIVPFVSSAEKEFQRIVNAS